MLGVCPICSAARVQLDEIDKVHRTLSSLQGVPFAPGQRHVICEDSPDVRSKLHIEDTMRAKFMKTFSELIQSHFRALCPSKSKLRRTWISLSCSLCLPLLQELLQQVGSVDSEGFVVSHDETVLPNLDDIMLGAMLRSCHLFLHILPCTAQFHHLSICSTGVHCADILLSNPNW